MIALIAGIGIGSIIAAVIAWYVNISNHRQAWIDALRDDLAAFFKELEIIYHAVSDLLAPTTATDGSEALNKTHEARIAILFVHRRILLRLNRTEPMHVELADKLASFMRVSTKVPDQQAIEDTVDLARRLLKQEWEVTKWGPFTRLMRWWRSHRDDR
jgi:hypothetical protein